MSGDELRAEKAQMQQSLAAWQAQLEEAQNLIRRAQEQATAAQRQLDIHSGHIERIDMWLAKLEQSAPKIAEPAPSDLLIEAEK